MSNAAEVAALEEGEWEYPEHHTYQCYISELMSLHEGRLDDPYERNQEYTREQLLSITPTVVKRYLNWKAYRDPDPHPDAPVTDVRAESLRKVKQAIS